MRITLFLLLSMSPEVLVNITTESSHFFWKCNRTSGLRCLLYTFLHPSSGADEITGESEQLVTGIHDEGDGLTLFE
jgi:hypothetical protein